MDSFQQKLKLQELAKKRQTMVDRRKPDHSDEKEMYIERMVAAAKAVKTKSQMEIEEGYFNSEEFTTLLKQKAAEIVKFEAEHRVEKKPKGSDFAYSQYNTLSKREYVRISGEIGDELLKHTTPKNKDGSTPKIHSLKIGKNAIVKAIIDAMWDEVPDKTEIAVFQKKEEPAIKPEKDSRMNIAQKVALDRLETMKKRVRAKLRDPESEDRGR